MLCLHCSYRKWFQWFYEQLNCIYNSDPTKYLFRKEQLHINNKSMFFAARIILQNPELDSVALLNQQIALPEIENQELNRLSCFLMNQFFYSAFVFEETSLS